MSTNVLQLITNKNSYMMERLKLRFPYTILHFLRYDVKMLTLQCYAVLYSHNDTDRFNRIDHRDIRIHHLFSAQNSVFL